MLDRIFDLAKINKTIAHLSKKMRDIYYNYLINEYGVSFTYHSNMKKPFTNRKLFGII